MLSFHENFYTWEAYRLLPNDWKCLKVCVRRLNEWRKQLRQQEEDCSGKRRSPLNGLLFTRGAFKMGSSKIHNNNMPLFNARCDVQLSRTICQKMVMVVSGDRWITEESLWYDVKTISNLFLKSRMKSIDNWSLLKKLSIIGWYNFWGSKGPKKCLNMRFWWEFSIPGGSKMQKELFWGIFFYNLKPI